MPLPNSIKVYGTQPVYARELMVCCAHKAQEPCPTCSSSSERIICFHLTFPQYVSSKPESLFDSTVRLKESKLLSWRK